ncbi:lipoate--protein ligase family protein [Botrimarina hoheduenensis]|uniref:Octanoyltransferase LipM n=1 Tax=Botrimarina hoheduenensis TaxID=2528000 RepID=A0A5C5VXN9_9BACT|nr:hypothetical protein [Botrimarina hoheduenensis]TWT42481.1 Octanoyltransferase LipM [Botrimarina hoheduenensis]
MPLRLTLFGEPLTPTNERARCHASHNLVSTPLPALPCRLLHNAPAAGDWNMAVDDVLLDTVADQGLAALRFYRWGEPTLSLGYFQAHTERSRHSSSRALPMVRRTTGGGALVHDHELTYALTLPASSGHTKDPTALTCLVHRALSEALASLGFPSEAISTCAAAIPAADQPEPFLCFQRRSRGDLLAREASSKKLPMPAAEGLHKVCGSAQRRRRGALLQHGGVLLGRSRHAPELLGMMDLGIEPGGCIPDSDFCETLAEAWATRIAETAGLTLAPSELSQAEQQAAQTLMEERFRSTEWTQRR